MSMFGALNRLISRLDAEPQAQKTNSRSPAGFQVLRNTNPEVHIEPWFDFVIGINGRSIDNPDPSLFATEVRNCAGSSVELGLWSAKGQRVRSLWVQIPADTASLGLSLQWKPLSASDDVWHILDVTPNSPADAAGLLPYGDYIIGSPEGLVKGESGMGELVEQFLNRPLRLWVYNHEYDVTRLVTMEPSRSWGGTGALGCVLGFGALHRIPPSLEEPPQAPGETLFGSARTSMDQVGYPGAQPQDLPILPPAPTDSPHYLVPVDMDLPPPPQISLMISPPAAGPPRKAGQKTRPRAAPALDMDDYFKEGEAKSREQDFAPSRSKAGTPIAPPPKVGGPPPPSKAGEASREMSKESGTAEDDGAGLADEPSSVEEEEAAAVAAVNM